MNEPTIIEKLEKEPTEVVETPVDVKKGKTGLGLLVIVIALVIVFPLAVLGYLFATGQLHLGDGTNGEEDVVEEEDSQEETPLTESASHMLIEQMLSDLDIDAEVTQIEIDWRTEDSDITISLDNGYSFEIKDKKYENVEAIVDWLTKEGFSDDMFNVADGPQGGNWGYYKNDLGCIVSHTDVNFMGPNEDGTFPEYEESRTIIVSCGEGVEIVEDEAVSEELSGEYIGITTDVLDGSEYYQFQNVDMVNSQSTVYLVNKDSVSSLNLDLVEGTTYTITGEKNELEGGAAAGTTYVEVVDVTSILDAGVADSYVHQDSSLVSREYEDIEFDVPEIYEFADREDDAWLSCRGGESQKMLLSGPAQLLEDNPQMKLPSDTDSDFYEDYFKATICYFDNEGDLSLEDFIKSEDRWWNGVEDITVVDPNPGDRIYENSEPVDINGFETVTFEGILYYEGWTRTSFVKDFDTGRIYIFDLDGNGPVGVDNGVTDTATNVFDEMVQSITKVN